MTEDIPKQPYLKNRLYWAFEAGVESGEHDARLQKSLEWYESQLKELRKEKRNLIKELRSLRETKEKS